MYVYNTVSSRNLDLDMQYLFQHYRICWIKIMLTNTSLLLMTD